VSDFEYEFQMALMNRKLRSTVETVFLMPQREVHVHLVEVDQGRSPVSERLSQEWFPPVVEKRLTEKYPLK